MIKCGQHIPVVSPDCVWNHVVISDGLVYVEDVIEAAIRWNAIEPYRSALCYLVEDPASNFRIRSFSEDDLARFLPRRGGLS